MLNPDLGVLGNERREALRFAFDKVDVIGDLVFPAGQADRKPPAPAVKVGSPSTRRDRRILEFSF
jgi:hypothetical protein